MHSLLSVISILFLGVIFCEPFPKVLHQIWISRQDIPPKWENARRAWISLHPTWKHRLWNETQCRDLISSRYQWFLEQWESHKHPLQRTEVCRFFVLHNYGGMYADLNVRPRRSLESILQSQEYNSKQIVLLEDEQTAIFASRAKSPFWDDVFAMIGERHQWGQQFDGSSLIGMVARRDQSRVGTFPSQNFPRICEDCETPHPSNAYHWISIEPGHHPSTSHVSRLLSSFYRKVLKPLFSVYTLLAMFFAVMTYLIVRRIRQGSHSKQHHQTHQRRKVWILIVAFVIILIITLPISGTAQSALRGNPDGEKVAFITAHPDDESMFFVPSIRGTLEQHNDLYLLCLSNGNAQGLGATREPELMSAAQLLGFKHVHVMNHPDLQDGPQRKWDVDLIAGIVEEYVKNHTITTIITFDHMGVSGHPNHIAVSNGVKQVLAKREGQLQVYQLRSVNRLEKFSGIFDIIPSALSNSDLLFLRSPVLAWKAMARHYSQFVWFRKLFVIFSRYTYINTLVQVRL